MTKKNIYRKYAFGTIAAAAAVTSIAPAVASADTTEEFPDVKEGDSGFGAVGVHYDSIMNLADQGIIGGKEDGNFYPWDNVVRGQVAKMFAIAKDLDTPEALNEVLSIYDDVDANNDYAKEIAAATEANIFGGNEENKFGEYDKLSREQMASVLVRAFDLDEIEADKVDINLDKVSEAHQDAVQTLANLGITKELSDFGAYDEITRAAFSTFLDRTMKVVEDNQDLTVKSVNATTSVVDKEGTLEFAVNGSKEAASLEQVEEAGYKVNFKADADIFEDNKNTSSTGKLDTTSGTYHYQVEITKDGETVAESKRVIVKVEDFAEEVVAIESTEVRLGNIVSDSGVLTKGDDARLVVNGTTKANNEAEAITEKVNVTSDTPAIATISQNGQIKLNGAKGDVTFTIESGDLKETVTVKVVSEERIVDADNSEISTSALDIASGKTAEFEVTLLDQFGDVVVIQDQEEAFNVVENKVLDKESPVTAAFNKEDNTYNVTFTAGNTKGEEDITLKADDTELGTIGVNVKEPGDVASYRATVENKELDLNKGLEGKDSTTLKLTSLDAEGLVVDENLSIGDNFITKSSDSDIVSIDGAKLMAESTGTATITVYQEKGAFEDEVASVDVKVVDSTPAITGVQFVETEGQSATEDLMVDLEDVIESITVTDFEGNTATASIAGPVEGESNRLVIKDDNGNDIGSVLIVTDGNLNPDVAENTVTFKQQATDVADTVTVSVLDHNDKVVGSTDFEIEIAGKGTEE